MPGIHILSTSEINSQEPSKEPALNIPGSYWICYKDNIYKFSFKYNQKLRLVQTYLS